ncbi:MAG TPA: class I SAM-dependent methyltransferase [Thermoleophilia bacterium]|nr:class I SAM-dependent methyltransferase [Thermoleophilia bacterium]
MSAMTNLTEAERAVGSFYDEQAESEITRLDTLAPVEYAMTARYLERYVAAGSTVADVGVGGGQYDEFLARRGCRLHLADVSERLLAHAVSRLESCRFGDRVADARVASATDLAHLRDASCDAVLLLGPLYHLLTIDERRRAVAEGSRVLRPGGILFATACNRFAGLTAGFVLEPERGAELLTWYRQFLVDGLVDPAHAPGIGYAHFSTIGEFEALFAGSFETVLFAGLESITEVDPEQWAGLPEPDRMAWLELVELTASSRDALAMSGHLLFVGRRPA